MRKITNPFITGGYVSSEYFCDREQESIALVKNITNGNNIVLISPRRMGKTGLIEHCFHYPEISDKYYTFFLDIYSTSSLRELVFLLGRQIFETLKPKGRAFIDNFFQVISSLRPAFKLDVTTGEPVFDIGLGEIKELNFSLEEIFKYLEQADKPCVVAIDEFQQIAKYPEKNVEALLRTYIQHSKNTSYIFAGSQRHLLENIFFSSSRPFYQSVQALHLQAISLESYQEFAINKFDDAGKKISKELIEIVYKILDGHTWYLQNIMNEIFSLITVNEVVDLDVVKQAFSNKLINLEPFFQTTLNLLTERQKDILIAISKEGKATAVMSGEFIKKHALHSASSVQTSLKQLLEKEIITHDSKCYYVYDRFFGLWLRSQYGIGSILKTV
jgi:hypothetical protein